MRIFTIILMSFIFIGMSGGTIGMYYCYTNSVDVLEQEVYEDIDAVIKDRIFHIEHFLELQKKHLMLIATYQEHSSGELEEMVKINSDFNELFVVSAEGETILSSDMSKVGWDRRDNEYFLNAEDGGYVKKLYFSETTGEYSIAISVPYQGGVLVARIGLNEMEEFVVKDIYLGGIGNIYYINRDFYIISSSENQWEQDDILKQKIVNVDLEKCFERRDSKERRAVSDVEEFFSYSGDIVLGGYEYIPEMDWCLLVEFNKENVINKPKIVLLKIVLIVFVLILVFTIILGGIFSRIISKPIENMTKNIDDVTKGNFDIKLKESKIKEFRLLIDALSRVLVSLKLAVLRGGATKKEIDLGEAIRAKRESDEKLRQVIENTDQFMYTHDINGKITYASPQSEKMFGYTPNEMMRNWEFFITKNMANEEGKSLTQKAIKTGVKQKPYLLEIKRKDGKKRWIQIRESLIKNKKGVVTGVSGVVTDVTEEERTKVSFDSIFSNAAEAMVLLSVTGEVKAMNSEAEKLYGAPKETLVGKHFAKAGVFPLAQIPKLILAYSKTLRGKGDDVDTVLNNKKGEKIFVRILGSNVGRGKMKEMFLMLRRINEKGEYIAGRSFLKKADNGERKGVASIGKKLADSAIQEIGNQSFFDSLRYSFSKKR